jgi:1-acyl-sn-glycerol-3-phosphate acyltransferase
MLGFMTVLAYFLSLVPLALVNRFFYALDRKRCPKVNSYLTSVCARRAFALSGTYIGFRFAGEKNLKDELPDQYIVISNHQSLLDIPLYARFLDGPRLRFVAKAELGRNIPLISVLLRSGQHCLVKRSGSPTQAMRSMDAFAERIKKNGCIPVIFPEGTRSRDGKIGTFHAAGFRRLVDRAPMPVAVCALDGVWRVSSLFGLAKNLKGGKYRVKILKIYPAPATKADAVHILEEGRSLIEAQLAAWNGSALL